MKPAEYRRLQAGAMRENELLSQARRLAQAFRLLTYHPCISIRSEPGWPDLAVLGPGGFLLRELKTMKGRLTTEQAAWLTGFQAVDVDAGLWRPVDLLEGRIEHELRALR